MDRNRAWILGDAPQPLRPDPNLVHARILEGDLIPRGQAAPVDVAARALPGGGGTVPPRVPPGGGGVPPGGGGVPPSGGQRALPPPRDLWTGYPAAAEGGKKGLWEATKKWGGGLTTLANWDLMSSLADKVQLPQDSPLVPGISNRAVGMVATAMMPWLMRAEKLGGVVGADTDGLDAASKQRMEMGERGERAWDKFVGSAGERSGLHVVRDAALNTAGNVAKSMSPFGGEQRRAAARDQMREAALDAAIKEEADNIAGYDRNKSLRQAAELRRTSPDVQTETVTYDENGNLRVTPGGEQGAPGVLAYYNPTTAKFTDDGKTGKVDFGQGQNYAEFDTSTPFGKAAAERIQKSIADGIPEYRQGKKYVTDGGFAMPFQSDLDARTYAAQGGGMSYAQNPEATKQARLESYARASDLINQTRAIARGIDPRLAGLLDKQRDGSLRAATRAMRQAPADDETFAQELALKRAGLRQAAAPKPEKKEKAQDLAFNNLKTITQDEKLAGRIFGHLAQKGIYPTNPGDAQAWVEQYQMMLKSMPPELREYNPLDFTPIDMKSPGSWNPFSSQMTWGSPKSGEKYSFDDMDPETHGRMYSQFNK